MLKIIQSPLTWCMIAGFIASSNANIKSCDGITNCADIFGRMHACNGKFVEIAMNLSDPFTICTDITAYHDYNCTLSCFKKLTTTYDHKNSTALCSEKYINKNRMNVVSMFIAATVNLWESANCDNCYDAPDPSHNLSFSQSTQDFLHFQDLQRYCIRNITSNSTVNNSVVCSACEKPYEELNSIFEHIKKTSANKICFDLEDMMNKTRREWSGLYKCCKDKRDSLTAFYSLAASVFIIAISFYCAVYFFGGDSPSTLTLDESDFARRNPTATGPSSSRPSSHRHRPAKRQLVINQSDESDEEILTGNPTPNANLIALSS